MTIERHGIDLEAVREVVDLTRAGLPKILEGSRDNPSNLGMLINEALDLAAGTSAIDPDSPEIGRYLRLAAQAHAALFAVASAGGQPVAVPLGDGEPARYRSGVAPSLAHAARWVRGFCLAAACRDAEALDRLCDTPTELLRASPTTNAEYVYRLVDALRSVHRVGGTDAGALILAAMDATDPDERGDIARPDYALSIDVPLIELLFHVNARDPDFAGALPRALGLHREFWSKGANRKDWGGFLALGPLGMAAMAHDRGMAFDVASDYLPARVVRGEAA